MRPFRMHGRETQSMTGFQRFLTAKKRVNHVNVNVNGKLSVLKKIYAASQGGIFNI